MTLHLIDAGRPTLGPRCQSALPEIDLSGIDAVKSVGQGPHFTIHQAEFQTSGLAESDAGGGLLPGGMTLRRP